MGNVRRSGRISSRVLIALGAFAALILLGIGVFYGHRYRVRRMAEQTLVEGKAAFEKGDWDEARRLLGRYLRKYPMGDAEALAQYAEAQLAVRPLQPANIGTAINAYRRLLLVYARSADEVDDSTVKGVYRELARLYERAGNYVELGFIARERLEKVPDDVDVAIWQAKSLLALRRPDDARERLETLIDRLKDEEEKHPEYVQACILLSVIAAGDASRVGNEAVLAPLDEALEYDPGAVDALLQRAVLRKQLAGRLFGEEREKMLQAARQDLERADELAPAKPLQRLMLAEAWINEGEFDRVARHLEAVKSPDARKLLETFVDPDDWIAARFIVAAKLATRAGTAAEAAQLADDTLKSLAKFLQRQQVIPLAIPIYLAADQVSDARRYLDEFLQETALAQSSPEQEGRNRYLKALVALAEGRPYETIQLLEPIVMGGMPKPEIQRLLADAYIQADQPSRAAATLTDYLNKAPADLATTKTLVRQHLKQQAWTNAVAVARRVEQVDPDDVEIKLLRIQAQIRSLKEGDANDREALEAELIGLRDADPGQVEIRVYLAHLLAQADRHADAEAELKQAIEVCDDSLLAELELAVLYAATNRQSEAVEVGRQTCERHPTIATPWLALARLLVFQGEPREACAVLQQGCEAVTSAVDKQLMSRELGVAEVLYADRTAGIARLRQLASEAPNDIKVRDILLNLPETLAESGVAEALIEEIKDITGETGPLWRFHQARLLLSGAEWRAQRQEIMALLRYCVNADRSWTAPAVVLGRMYEDLGLFAEAERLYTEALQRSGAIAVADRLLSILQRQRRFAEARRVLDDVRHRTASHLLDRRSISLAVQSGDLSGAISELQLRLRSDDAAAEDLLAMARLVYLQEQDATRAREYLEQARAIAPDSLDCIATTLFILKEDGHLDEAKELIDEFVDRKGDFESHLLRATFYQWIGDDTQAVKNYQDLTGLSEDGLGYAILGEYHAQSGRLSEAIAIWEQGLEKFPEEVRLKRGVAKALIVRASPGDRERAESMLAELKAAHPNEGEIYWALAELKLKENTKEAVDEARRYLEKAIELDPVRIEPYLRLVPILLDRQAYAAAKDLVVRALAIHPRDERLLLARAAVELSLDNTTAATDFAQRVLKVQPESVAAVDLLAEIAMRAGQLDPLLEYRDQVTRGLEQQPDNTRLQVAHAMMLVVDGKRDVALERLESSVIVTAAGVLARCDGGRFQEDARALYEHVIASAPENMQAYVGLALLAYEQGDLAEAMSAYRRALKVDPSNVAVLNNLAWIMTNEHPDDAGVLKEALRFANEAVRLDPADANLRDTRGFVLSKLPGKLEEAREEYKKCVELTAPDTAARPKALLRLARVCYALNDGEAVKRLLDDAHRLGREFDVFSPQEWAEMEQMLSSAMAPQ